MMKLNLTCVPITIMSGFVFTLYGLTRGKLLWLESAYLHAQMLHRIWGAPLSVALLISENAEELLRNIHRMKSLH